MNEPLTLNRFQELADAYGGVVARWPEQHRDAAMGIASQPVAIAILARASVLDETLDAWTVPASAYSLRKRVIAGAPTPRRSLAARTRLWWSGVGIAAVLAGAAAGTAAVAMVSPIDALPESGTSFGDVGSQGI